MRQIGFFNFLNQERQVGLRKTEARSWNTVVLNIRWHVFVVWVRCCQFRNVRVLLRQSVDEFFVIMQRTKWIHDMLSV